MSDYKGDAYTVPGVSVQEMYGSGHVQTRYTGRGAWRGGRERRGRGSRGRVGAGRGKLVHSARRVGSGDVWIWACTNQVHWEGSREQGLDGSRDRVGVGMGKRGEQGRAERG